MIGLELVLSNNVSMKKRKIIGRELVLSNNVSMKKEKWLDEKLVLSNNKIHRRHWRNKLDNQEKIES